jgi:hypothetical protein
MIVVEYSNEDYGKIMEYVSCIEKKASKIKDILAEDTMDHRYKMRYKDHEEDEDDYEDYKFHSRKKMSRYA